MEIDCGPCLVRSWRKSDVDSLVRHANNQKVWLQLRDRFPHPYTAADGEAWLVHACEAEPEKDLAIDVAGEAAGGIGLTLGSDVERISAEIGFWLGESLWGRGIVTAAVRAFTARAFSAYGLQRIFALPFAGNTASRRVLEKSGFALEGILRRSALKAGRVTDQALYALVIEKRSALDLGLR